jgi:hypothetical protein
MGDRPYTDEDLRAEAARQHATLIEDPDYMGVGEQMDDETVPSLAEHGSTWGDLLSDNDALYDDAQRAIHDLINGAADTSRWAVDLGADGLQPHARVIDIGWNDGPLQARIHIAFPDDAGPREREQFITDIADTIAGTVPVR